MPEEILESSHTINTYVVESGEIPPTVQYIFEMSNGLLKYVRYVRSFYISIMTTFTRHQIYIAKLVPTIQLSMAKLSSHTALLCSKAKGRRLTSNSNLPYLHFIWACMVSHGQLHCTIGKQIQASLCNRKEPTIPNAIHHVHWIHPPWWGYRVK